MPLSITLRDSNHNRVEYLEDPDQWMLAFNSLARSGRGDDLIHLSAIDLYGEVIFNHLQVPQLLREITIAKTSFSESASLDSFVEEIYRFAGSVDSFCWYIHILGD